MKNLAIILSIVCFLFNSKISIFAEEIYYSTPEYNAEAIVQEDIGMTNNFTYSFKNGEIDLYDEDILLMVNGEFIPFKLIRNGDTTFVPIRAISEAFDKKVIWDNENRTVIVDNIKFKINSKKVNYGDEEINLEYAPFINENITYVPLRFIAESFGKEVEYISKNSYPYFENDLVWIEDKAFMNNAGYSNDEVLAWIQEEINKNPKFFKMEGNSPVFTEDSVENMEYICQIGRYALFNSSFTIFVDMENESFYFYFKGVGYNGIYYNGE